MMRPADDCVRCGSAGPYGAEGRGEVDGEDLVEVVVAHLGDLRAADQVARIADQYVEPAEEAGGLLDQAVHIGGDRHIGLERLRPAAQCLDRGDRLRGLVGGGVVVDGDIGAGLGEGDGDGTADAVARPRHQCAGAVEISRHG
ncbi:hypothetical protein ACVWXU_008162 [Streptomyces sp. TE33382]